MPEKSTMNAPGVPAGEQVARRLNEVLYDIRRTFGMHGGTNWRVHDVSAEVITIAVSCWPKKNSPDFVAAQVSNAILAFVQDMVPCPTFRAVFLRPVGEPTLFGPMNEVATLQCDFYSRDVEIVPGPIILIEENVEPLRRQWSPVIKTGWSRLGGVNS